MTQFRQSSKLLRKMFGKVKEVVSLPDLIEVQSKSFNNFVQLDFLPSERENVGLEKVMRDVFPIEHNYKISIEYVSYELGDWACQCGQLTKIEKRYTWSCTSCKKNGCSRLNKDIICPECKKETARYLTCKKCSSRVILRLPFAVDECRYSGKTYALPLRVSLQLVTWDVPEDIGLEKEAIEKEKKIRDIKQEEILFCELPVMLEVFEDDQGCYKLGNQGTFLVNGVDRVVVSQLHRAPGVVFTLSKRTKDYRGQPFHLARIIPSRGSWIDFEFDHNDILYVRIDKKKKILATTFLHALGVQRDQLLSLFYSFDKLKISKNEFCRKVDKDLLGTRLEVDTLAKKIEKELVIGQRITEKTLDILKKNKISYLPTRKQSMLNRVFASNIVHPDTGEILAEHGNLLTEELFNILVQIEDLEVLFIKSSGYSSQPIMASTLTQDTAHTREDALREVYFRLRPGDVPAVKVMEEYLTNLFFNQRFYDLSLVGRIRTNRKLNLNIDTSVMHLTLEDIIAAVKYLLGLKERGEGELDDIDHLGNRCVRLVGELLQSQFYVGFARIERIIKERFRLQEMSATVMPYDFINIKPLSAVIREFFGSGQLSQFMDQTNPLAETAHKRRLSALGPGGITRERATFEVRDVHTSHYGRICPIETPEGQNIGLISSLATYAHVNDLGFIETMYRPVKKGIVQDEIVSFDAFQEAGEYIAQATIPIDAKGALKEGKILARKSGNIVSVDAKEIAYVDVSPRQLVSVATALIPFLEHDDANRALMGSNMQRQTVPLIKCQAPLIGTGMESELGKHEGAVIVARDDGIVEYVCADKIVVRLDQDEIQERWLSRPIDTYLLKKFGRSSHNTWIHHTPIVKTGQRIKRGQVLTNGSAIVDGELALGSNVLVVFMPWHGYNFEDAIIVSKRLVRDDVFTSVHIEEFVVEARDTKLGAEEITNDIPNVSEKGLEGLDDDGIVRIGTRINPGDILVGKVTLKGDVQVSPEEKLLRAIFGEVSREVRDTSLRVSPGISGTVIDVKVFSRSGIRKDKRYKNNVIKETEKLEESLARHFQILAQSIKEKLISIISGAKIAKGADVSAFTSVGLFVKRKLEEAELESLFVIKTTSKVINNQIKKYQEVFKNQQLVLEEQKEEQISKLRKGDELPSGVIKMVRVSIAIKRHLSVGDKVAGRHGNKGVISQIVNREDMPYMKDGTPVDIVLNPLGVPGRMNVGQILETMLGMAGRQVGKEFCQQLQAASYAQIRKDLCKYYGSELIDQIEQSEGKEKVQDLARKTAQQGLAMKTPIFDAPSFDEDIKPMLKDLGLSQTGTYTLYNGLTGQPFDQPVTVGVIYMMKLNHLADNKLHARSVGPYSLITQQPLGGKAQFGGQRLGEMEVWALYAHGAAYTLQEMLTVKSDDVHGRVKAYESIVRGDDVPEPGIPESFNVLIKELQSLGLQVDLFKTSKEQASE